MVGDDMTHDEVLAMIKNSAEFQELKKDRKVDKVTIKILSEDGYLSVVFNATILFDDKTEFSFIIKKLSVARYFKAFDVDEDASHLNALQVYHNRECKVYGMLKNGTIAPRLYSLQPVVDVKKDPGFILMESLVGKAGAFGLFTTPTDQLCINVAHHLGKLRAEVSEVPLENYGDWDDPFRIDFAMIDGLIDKHIPALYEHDKETFRPLVEKLKPFRNIETYAYLLKRRAVDLGVQSLVHADLHGNNMIVKHQPDGTPSNEVAAFIDWQASFCGNSLFDIARFFSFSDADIRRRVEQQALDEYFSAYLKYSKNPNRRLTREVIQELYDLGLIMEAIEWMNLFGILLENIKVDNKHEFEALKARVALRARFNMEDGIRLIEKYNLKKGLDSIL